MTSLFFSGPVHEDTAALRVTTLQLQTLRWSVWDLTSACRPQNLCPPGTWTGTKRGSLGATRPGFRGSEIVGRGGARGLAVVPAKSIWKGCKDGKEGAGRTERPGGTAAGKPPREGQDGRSEPGWCLDVASATVCVKHEGFDSSLRQLLLGVEPLHVCMSPGLKPGPSTSLTHPGSRHRPC
jgi:hypothetical protein